MAGLLPSPQGLLRWSPTSTAHALGLPVDVVRDYGATYSLETTTGTIAAGQNDLTLARPIDFQNGQGIAIQGAGPDDNPLVTTIISGGGSRFLTLAAPAATAVSCALVEHDESWAWQAAIDGAVAPAVVTCPPGVIMKIGATLTLRSQVLLAFPAATLQWTGPAGEALFQSANDQVLFESGLVGGIIDPGEAGKVADLYSPQSCTFDLTILDGASTLTVMAWTAAKGKGGPEGALASAGNRVNQLVAGTCGTLLSLSGAPGSPVVANLFLNLEGRDCRARGVLCQQSGYVSTNLFLQTNLTLSADDSVGIDLGEIDSAPGISNLLFAKVLINNPLGKNCTGLYLHNASQVQVQSYCHTGFPPGTTLNGGKAGSYYISDVGDGTTSLIRDQTAGWSVTPLQVGPSGTPITNHLSSYQLVGLVTVPPQSGQSTSVQIAGVRQGDTVIATPSGMMPIGIAWGASVLSEGTVTLYFTNPSEAAPVPIGPIHWRFDIWQH